MTSAALAILNGAISSLQAESAAQQSTLATTNSIIAALQSLVTQNTPEVAPVESVPPTDGVPV